MIWRLLTSAGRRQRQRMKHEQAMNDSKNKADTLPEWRPNMNRGRSQDRGLDAAASRKPRCDCDSGSLRARAAKAACDVSMTYVCKQMEHHPTRPFYCELLSENFYLYW
jgi:hypothetical protein